MEIYEGDNIGGIAELELAFTFAFSSFFPAVMRPGASWDRIAFDSGSMSVKTSEADNGPVYNYAVAVRVHNMRDDVDAVIGKYIAAGCVARVVDLNGRVYLLGSPDMPVSLVVSGGTGEKPTDENGIDIKLSIEMGFAAPQL